MPFWNLNILPRYMPQFTSLADHVGELTILYVDGIPIPHKNIRYHKLAHPIGVNRIHCMYRLIRSVSSQVNDIDFDVVYCLSGRWLQQAADRISKKTGKPLVLRIRGDERRVAKYQNRRILRNIFFKNHIESSFKQASLIIPIAQKLIEVANNLGGKNISEPIPNGIDDKKFYPTAPPNKITVGCIGRVSKEKGSQFLNELISSTPEIDYVVAGPIQTRFDHTKNCKMLGSVPYDKIQEVYQSSNVLLIPSHIEGYPNSLLEAYGCARPIIITPGAFPVEAKLFGWCMPQNVDAWSKVISGLDRDGLESLGLEAYEYSKEFTWDKHGKRMAQVIGELERA